jgi:hypothetical protein
LSRTNLDYVVKLAGDVSAGGRQDHRRPGLKVILKPTQIPVGRSGDTGTVDGFEAHRSHLRAVAYRMLGSLSEADDAVQEAWLRLARTDTNDIHNTRAWLTTVVARVPGHVALPQAAP